LFETPPATTNDFLSFGNVAKAKPINGMEIYYFETTCMSLMLKFSS
jgi:hypothetical protein